MRGGGREAGKEKTGNGDADAKVGEERSRRRGWWGGRGGRGSEALVSAGAVFICSPEALTRDPCRQQ